LENEQQTNEQSPTARRVIHDVGMLDFRSFTAPEDLSGISRIHDVGLILIPESLAPALAKVELEDVGAVVPIPEGGKVTCFTGQTKLTGEALEKGDSESTLLLVGQTFITTPCRTVGYRDIRVHGQLFATRGSEAALSSKMTSMNGQNFYLPANPRFVMGELELTADYLNLLPEPAPLVVMGALRVSNDVSAELLKSKILEIVLMGEITAPKRLLPLLEVLTPEKMGDISATDGDSQ